MRYPLRCIPIKVESRVSVLRCLVVNVLVDEKQSAEVGVVSQVPPTTSRLCSRSTLFSGDPDPVFQQVLVVHNRLKPWENAVAFHGYWETGRLVKTNVKDVEVSLYLRPDAALFVSAIRENRTLRSLSSPVWKELKLNPAELHAVDAENDQPVSMADGLKLEIPRHDVRVVLVAKPGL